MALAHERAVPVVVWEGTCPTVATELTRTGMDGPVLPVPVDGKVIITEITVINSSAATRAVSIWATTNAGAVDNTTLVHVVDLAAKATYTPYDIRQRRIVLESEYDLHADCDGADVTLKIYGLLVER